MSEETRGEPVKITVVDRRHHARDEPGGPVRGEERSPFPTVVEEMKARAEAAERRAREALERAEGEIDAVRERLQRDVDRRVAQGQARLLREMLEVADNMERAVEAAVDHPAVADGIRLVHQQFMGVMKAEGVEPLETLGREYDPEIAEAVGVEEVDPGRDNHVIEEIRRGFRFGETVLRPARVKVGKASARTPSD